MILDLCGGEASKVRMAGEPPLRRLELDFDGEREFARLTGASMKEDEISRILQGLGFGVKKRKAAGGKGGKGASQGATQNAGKDGALMRVSVPEWRPDVHGAADLVEELVRIYGVDNIGSAPLERLSGVARPVLTLRQKRVRRARRALAGRGMVEAVTWSFIPREQARMFGGGADELELDNPISADMSSMRPGLLPGLLAAARRNRARNMNDAALFEVGQAYGGPDPQDQLMIAAGARFGQNELTGSGRHWSGDAMSADLFAVKADCMAVLAHLGMDAARLQVSRDAPDFFHPGRSGTVRLGPKNVLGHFGEIHPGLMAKLDMDGPLAGFEIFLDNLPEPRRRQAGHSRGALDISELHPVRRDFAFILDAEVAAGDVMRAAMGADRKMIEAVNVFDSFEGEALGAGRKSVAIEVVIQPRGESLTDKQIEAISDRIVKAVEKATGGSLRS
jgi:phenylalanyl-tRNA synthetase beta chain